MGPNSHSQGFVSDSVGITLSTGERMILLTGFYEDPNAVRRGEFLECLRRNVANDCLGEIHVFVEEPHDLCDMAAANPLLGHARIRLIPLGRRVTFRDFFAYANCHLSGQRVIIANADIYTDSTLALLEGHDLTGKLLCLSRWDVLPEGPARFFDHPSSQDAWIFESPIREFFCDFYLGLPGCDNRLAWEAGQAGLLLSNPGHSLRVYHLHLSGIHRGGEGLRLVGPCACVPAEAFESQGPVVQCDTGETRDSGNVPSCRQAPCRETMFALTSLSPLPDNVTLVRQCIASWRDAGLQVQAFNHPDEITELARLYDVDFTPVTATTASVFGRHFVPIKAMLDWAAGQNAPALLVNSDIQLRMAPWELKRLRFLSDGGLCYFVRHNHDGNEAHSGPEPFGIDAFLLHGRDAALFPDSSLSMGQPFWDYWLPHVFARNQRPIVAVEFPAAFHRNHVTRWSWDNWHCCAFEFVRATGEWLGDTSLGACGAMSVRVRHNFDRLKIVPSSRPIAIMDWVQRKFQYAGTKTFLELGSHVGEDTAWLAEIPDVSVHAFEPDPRNHQPIRPNVMLHRAAVGERDGQGLLILSLHGWGQEWTHSSSIKQPKNHLQQFPVTFGDAVEVPLIRLDTFYRQHGLGIIDFIWADIQGAEGEMIRGGRQTLEHTRYVYTEYSDDELYENQATLTEILELLPDFRVVELWPEDVLLENTRLQRPS